MKRALTLIAAVAASALFFTAGSVAADAKYSAATLKKVDEFKDLKKNGKEMPATLDGVKIVTPEEAKKLFDEKKAVFLDNRPADEFEKEHIPGAKRLNSDDLLDNAKLAADAGLKADDVIVCYCNGEKCWRSPAVSVMLQNLGYKNVDWLRSGLPGWIKKGYETAEGKK